MNVNKSFDWFFQMDIQIKRAGVIPVKRSLGESIEWIHCDQKAVRVLLNQPNLLEVERIVIDMGEDYMKGIGCSICKGPKDRPGIYVQSIKANGAAHRHGLQLGDQILACNEMSFEGSALNFTTAVAQMRGRRSLNLIVKRGAGLDLVLGSSETSSINDEKQMLEDEKRLLKSQVQLERRKLEAEQERLRVEALKLEQEKINLKIEKERLLKKKSSVEQSMIRATESRSSNSTSSDMENNSSENEVVAKSEGGLVSAIQTELKRRASKQQYVPNPPVLKPIPTTTTNGDKKALMMQHNDQHDQLIAEFRKVHRKLFASSESTTSEDDDANRISEQRTTVSSSEEIGNRSYDETLVKPTKAPAPQQISKESSQSILSSTESSPSMMATFKPVLPPKENENSTPGIPTPDYDTTAGNSPEPQKIVTTGFQRHVHVEVKSHAVAKKPPVVDLKTFSMRHPEVNSRGSTPTPAKQKVNLSKHNSLDSLVHATAQEQQNHHSKNVRFDMSSEAAIAAHDYRVAHATRKAIRYTTELHKTLAVRSGLRNNSSATSSGVSSSSPSRSSPPCLSTSSSEEDRDSLIDAASSRRHQRAKSPKKYPAPPPPPPAPPMPHYDKHHSSMLPKETILHKGIE